MSTARLHASDDSRGRVDDLLIARALGDLDRHEAIELEALLALDPSLETDEFDLTAAALDLALDGHEETMPDALRRRVEADARVYFEVIEGRRTVEPARRSPAPAMRSRPAAWQWLATAAVVALTIGIGWSVRDGVPAPTSVDPTALRQQVLAHEDLVQWDWVGTEDPTVGAVSGDVVWSSEMQQGILRIGGLASNDPERFQYQLWIFDRERDERFPVDGGVFDIGPGSSEVLVPIRAKLPVDRPYLFAITVEQPGGVVVSSRERIAILAQPPAPAEG